ncbi:hypothetical protein AB0O07_12870 [Streptomyces sp. NPDC093085]|uniref:hypothetical protein n=1 Tax=Streptomyces sp. NPDC093085 TaxID=3155068 RepID=UPI0034246E29
MSESASGSGPSPSPSSSPVLGELRLGMVVFDRRYDMPGEIAGFAGPLVHLIRPTGLHWEANRFSLRLATPYEKRQLRALGALHRTRLKGIRGR